jgi:hypothetical protein
MPRTTALIATTAVHGTPNQPHWPNKELWIFSSSI